MNADITLNGTTIDLKLSITNKKDFMAFCRGLGLAVEKNKCGELYDYLVPYLGYLRKKKWNTSTLIKYTLIIDAAIETNRIGMVNYN